MQNFAKIKFGAVQKVVHLVDLEQCEKMRHSSQQTASIKPRMSRLKLSNMVVGRQQAERLEKSRNHRIRQKKRQKAQKRGKGIRKMLLGTFKQKKRSVACALDSDFFSLELDGNGTRIFAVFSERQEF